MRRTLYIRHGLKFFHSEEVGATFCKYGRALTGHSFDDLVLYSLPKTKRDQDWLDRIVKSRLQPGGEIKYNHDFFETLGVRDTIRDLLERRESNAK